MLSKQSAFFYSQLQLENVTLGLQNPNVRRNKQEEIQKILKKVHHKNLMKALVYNSLCQILNPEEGACLCPVCQEEIVPVLRDEDLQSLRARLHDDLHLSLIHI